MPQPRRRWRATRTGPRRTLSVRSRIVVAILVVAALGLAASGVASYLVQRKGALATVDATASAHRPGFYIVSSWFLTKIVTPGRNAGGIPEQPGRDRRSSR